MGQVGKTWQLIDKKEVAIARVQRSGQILTCCDWPQTWGKWFSTWGESENMIKRRSHGVKGRVKFNLLRSGSNLRKVILHTGRVRKTFNEKEVTRGQRSCQISTCSDRAQTWAKWSSTRGDLDKHKNKEVAWGQRSYQISTCCDRPQTWGKWSSTWGELEKHEEKKVARVQRSGQILTCYDWAQTWGKWFSTWGESEKHDEKEVARGQRSGQISTCYDWAHTWESDPQNMASRKNMTRRTLLWIKGRVKFQLAPIGL